MTVKKIVLRREVRPAKRRKAPVRSQSAIESGRLNIVIDPELKAWAKQYAEEHQTTVTQMIIDHFVILRKISQGLDVEQI